MNNNTAANPNQQSQPNNFAQQQNPYAQQSNSNTQQAYNNQNSYISPSYNQQATETPVSVGDWMLTLLVLAIPLVGIIMYFVWAFGNTTSKSKANFCKASLIWTGIGVGLYIFFLIVFGGIILSAFSYY